MAPAGVIVSGILGGVLFLLVLSIVIFVIYIQWFCVFYVRSKDERYSFKDITLMSDKDKKHRFIRKGLMIISPLGITAKDLDLESQNHLGRIDALSIEHNREISRRIKAQPNRSAVARGHAIIDISKDDTTEMSDYRSAMESMDNFTHGLLEILESRLGRSESYPGRVSSGCTTHQLLNNIETISEYPHNTENMATNDQYDSFSRTLMLQNMAGEFKDSKQPNILKVRDPFSDSFIVSGGIVVIVTPFHGKQSDEFTALQPGDLLRVINFYVKSKDTKPIKSIHCMSKEEVNSSVDITDLTLSQKSDTMEKLLSFSEAYPSQEDIVDKSNPFYENLYCTGVIMNTYLEYNSETSSLALKFRRKSSFLDGENDLMKDFPLKHASLETTVLRTMMNSPEKRTSFQAHFV